jgi:hypothetical protein
VRTRKWEDRKALAAYANWNNCATCWCKKGYIHGDRLHATCGISCIQVGKCHCASIGCTAEGRHQRSWQFPSSNKMQKNHILFATIKISGKNSLPSMRFIET